MSLCPYGSVCLSIFLSLSISMCIFLSLYRNCLYISLPFFLSFCLYISLPFFLSFCLFVLMCFCLAASLPFHLCVFMSLYLLSLSMSPICISLYLCFFKFYFVSYAGFFLPGSGKVSNMEKRTLTGWVLQLLVKMLVGTEKKIFVFKMFIIFFSRCQMSGSVSIWTCSNFSF